MYKSYIEEIEKRLVKEHIEIDLEVADDNITEYFYLLDIGKFKVTSEPLVEMILGAALSEDIYSVDLVKFMDQDFYALIFNMATAAGTYELIGISNGINPSSAFIRESLIRWTKVENFIWPDKVVIKTQDLLSSSVINELRRINDDC